MDSERAKAIIHRAYMQGYREGRLSVLSERRQTPRRTRVATVLERHLADGPKAAEWIVSVTMDESGCKERAVRAAKAELGIVSVRQRDRWVWCLPNASDTLQGSEGCNPVRQLALSLESGIMAERCNSVHSV